MNPYIPSLILSAAVLLSGCVPIHHHDHDRYHQDRYRGHRHYHGQGGRATYSGYPPAYHEDHADHGKKHHHRKKHHRHDRDDDHHDRD